MPDVHPTRVIPAVYQGLAMVIAAVRHGLGMVIAWSVVGCCSSGCVYDSRQAQIEEAQQQAAADATPTDLEAASSVRLQRPANTLHVRVYATPQHEAQVFDWRKRFAEQLEVVNVVLSRDHGVRLEAVEMRSWPASRQRPVPAKQGEDLDQLLEELARLDPAQDVAWVIGLAGQIPIVESDFHLLGNAQILGKHLMMRTPSDPAEREAIMRSFDRLDERQREALYVKRRKHRAAAVLLHELGHTLGCVHVEDSRAFMSPHYDAEMSGFAGGNAQIAAYGFRTRNDTWPGPDAAYARYLREQLRAHPQTGWLQADYDAMLELLRAALNAPAPALAATQQPPQRGAQTASTRATSARDPVPTGTIPSAPTAVPTSADLDSSQQALFTQTQQVLARGDAAGAWQLGEGLFEAQPNSFEVQELRCKVAMELGLAYDEISSHCRPMMELLKQQADRTGR